MGKSIRLLLHYGSISSCDVSGMQGTPEEDLISLVNFVENHRGEKYENVNSITIN